MASCGLPALWVQRPLFLQPFLTPPAEMRPSKTPAGTPASHSARWRCLAAAPGPQSSPALALSPSSLSLRFVSQGPCFCSAVKYQPGSAGTRVQSLGRGDPLGKGKAAHCSTDRSVHRQGTEHRGVARVSPEFAVVTSIIQVHSTAPHSRTDTLSPLRVKAAVFPSATCKGLRRMAWALGCR